MAAGNKAIETLEISVGDLRKGIKGIIL